jgi:hypothetical protein
MRRFDKNSRLFTYHCIALHCAPTKERSIVPRGTLPALRNALTSFTRQSAECPLVPVKIAAGDSARFEKHIAMPIKLTNFWTPITRRQHFAPFVLVAVHDSCRAMLDGAANRLDPGIAIRAAQRTKPARLRVPRPMAGLEFENEKAEKTVAVGGPRHLDAKFSSRQRETPDSSARLSR